MNVIILMIECWRKDVAYNPISMPFLNKLKENSIHFENCYTIAPSTHYAISSILTGKPPFSINSEWKLDRQKKNYFITNHLSDFYKIYITGNVINSSYYGYDYKFDYFQDFLKESKRDSMVKIKEMIRNIIPFRGDNIFLRKSKKIRNFILGNLFTNQNIDINEKIRFSKIQNEFFKLNLSNKKNIFAFLHFMEPHSPYCPENIKDKKIIRKIQKITKRFYSKKELTEEEVSFLKEMYEEEIKSLDKNLEIFVKTLKEKIDWNDTLLIITADHGEAFNETGYIGHPTYRLSNLHHLKIPFILTGGAIEKMDIRLTSNKLIWNKDIYDIIINYTKGNNVIKLKENDFILGTMNRNKKNIICSYFFPKEKKLLETRKNIMKLQENEFVNKIKNTLSK